MIITGSRVKIVGLEDNQEFNGDIATVMGFDDKHGVYNKVKLDRNMQVIGLAASNLELITEGAAAAAQPIAE